jgi:phytoene/squalene synthetase
MAILECQAVPLVVPRVAATAAALEAEGGVVAVTALEAVGWAAWADVGRAAEEAGAARLEVGAAAALGLGEAACLLGTDRGRGKHPMPATWLLRLHSSNQEQCLSSN